MWQVMCVKTWASTSAKRTNCKMCLGCVSLCVSLCSTEVLREVTFTVEAGQTVALVGYVAFCFV